ncbi:hypothetical protein EMN47_00840 [Prolixibacteraceae bacterium JC049]|nr:hypothetical protein [Prolixibacteraceae bacterium JC049]
MKNMQKAGMVFVFMMLGFVSFSLAQTNTARIVYFTIEGIQDTQLDYRHFRVTGVDEFEHQLIQAMVDKLSDKYSLEEIEIVQKPHIIRKPGLNRFKGVKKLKRKEKKWAQPDQLLFKIKCDIAFNESIGTSLILNTNSSRAALYINIGVFKNGKLQEKLKVKSKDDAIFIGNHADAAYWLSLSDFEKMYFSALDKLQ